MLLLKMGELKANHEAMKLELQSSHAEQLQCVKQQHDMSLEGEWTVLHLLLELLLLIHYKLTPAEKALSILMHEVVMNLDFCCSSFSCHNTRQTFQNSGTFTIRSCSLWTNR